MPLLRAIDRFFKHDAAGGILLMLSAILALVVANSALSPYYESFLNTYLRIEIGETGLAKPLILWINDGLMAIFFFLVGLELKHEIMEGKLKNPRDVVLPGMAAVGGMVVPALIYAALNWSNPATIGGWAIPAATDIAFALGILALVGKRAPASLKIFLLTLAILDDLGAILIIAIFYTAKLDTTYLLMALVPLTGMLWLNLKGSHRVAPILLLGAVLWVPRARGRPCALCALSHRAALCICQCRRGARGAFDGRSHGARSSWHRARIVPRQADRSDGSGLPDGAARPCPSASWRQLGACLWRIGTCGYRVHHVAFHRLAELCRSRADEPRAPWRAFRFASIGPCGLRDPAPHGSGPGSPGKSCRLIRQ